MRVLFGFPAIVISIIFTVLSSFFGLALPTFMKGLIDVASFICVIGRALGSCLVAYGSECSTFFPLKQETKTLPRLPRHLKR